MTTVIDLLEAAGVECYTREEWGSPRQRDGSYARRRQTHSMPPGPARYHFLHITVTPDTDTKLEGFEGAKKVESYGLSTPPMVSYQDLVTNEAKYFEGQNYGVKGTHTVNDKGVPGFPRDLNLYGYATALMQNVGDEVTDDQVRLIAMIFAARELLGLVVKGAPVYPHRMFDWKSCPGDKAVARLDDIIRLKNQYVREGRLPNIKKDWFDMADKEDLRAVIREELRNEGYIDKIADEVWQREFSAVNAQGKTVKKKARDYLTATWEMMKPHTKPPTTPTT